MVSDRAILEMNDRAIAIMLFYRGGQHRPADKTRMVAEIQEVAAWYRAAPISGLDLDQRVLRPIATGLVDRLGKVVGGRVHAEFLAALTMNLVEEPHRELSNSDRLRSHAATTTLDPR